MIMLTIYRATQLNSAPSIHEKIKHVVVKKGKVEILDNKKYIPNFSYDLTLEVGKSHAKELKKHIEENLEDFNKDFPSKFIELLKDKFDIQKQQQEQSEFNQENNSEVATSELKEQLKQHVLQSLSSSTISVLDRRNSVRYESIPENTYHLRKAPSFHDLPDESSPKISRPETPTDLYSLQDSIQSQNAEEQISLIASVQKISLEHNNNLAKMERHASNIKNGYFNGNEKSKILSEITRIVKQIRDASNVEGSGASNEQLDTLKQKVLELNEKINDNQKLKTLSRYRGISQSIATFFGYGKVTSIEYVNQLRKEFNPLINEVLSARPTV